MPTTYAIRTATPHDLGALITLRRDAEAWLHARGINQWTDHARGVATLRAGVHAGTTHIVTDHHHNSNDVVATMTLAGADPDFWTIDDAPDTALYLYKFIIGPGHRGTGLGNTMLGWASAQAVYAGKAWLRLDCWRTNHALHAYYVKHGFTLLRTVDVPGRNSGALMQRPARIARPDQDNIINPARHDPVHRCT
jgi:GNAT superfamily N-acetyltransferase